MQQTIKQLRRQGYKVRVLHFRNSDESRQLKARGGSTIIELTTPDKSKTVTGKSVCSLEDNYNKKMGAFIALGRALKDLEARDKQYQALY